MRGCCAVVTGAASGIGAAVARRYARAGAAVALLDLDGVGAEAVAAEIARAGGEARALRCDVASFDDARAAVQAAVDAFGGVDLLVANAGITHLGLARDTEPAVFRRVMDVNFFGAVHCALAALPSLLERRGAIAVLSSVAGFAPLATRAGYAASKHALHGFFGSLRAEHARDGLTVTLVCPSFVRTRIGAHALGPDDRPATAARSGVRGEIAPERVADALFRGVARGRRTVLVQREAWLSRWVSDLLPGVYDALMRRRTLGPG